MSCLISWIIPKEMAASPVLTTREAGQRCARNESRQLDGNGDERQQCSSANEETPAQGPFFLQKRSGVFCFGGKSQLQKKGREAVRLLRVAVD